MSKDIEKEIRKKIVVRIHRKEREMFLQKDISEVKQIEEIRKIVENALKDEVRNI